MKEWRLSIFSKIAVSLIFTLLLTSVVFGSKMEELNKMLETLEKEAEQTTDPTKLMQIQKKMMKVMQELMNLQETKFPGSFPKPAPTPEEKVKIACEKINAAGAHLRYLIARGAMPSEGQRIAVPHAIPIEGYVTTTGDESPPTPYHGAGWYELRYKITEKFVGYIIITKYYNTKKGKYDKDKDYELTTISTDIIVNSFGGKVCTESSGKPPYCTHWEHLTKYEISEENRYYHIHDWAALGDPEAGNIRITVESPNVLFLSANEKEGKGIGTAASVLKISNKKFESFLESGGAQLTLFSHEREWRVEFTLYFKIAGPECYIKFLDNRNGIYGCSEGGTNPTADVTLEGYLKKGIPVSYKWKILSGADIVKFSEGNSTSKKVVLHPISYSRMPNDVIVELSIKDSKGNTGFAICSLTVQKPTSLRKLSDEEIKALGIEPYVNYKELCNKGNCADCPKEICGDENKKIIDGYKRIIVFQVLDQFGNPITKPELFGAEKRWAIVGNKKIKLPYVGEKSEPNVPVNPNNPTGEKMTMFSGNGMTEKGGKIVDELGIMYPEGTSGVPSGLDITIEQHVTCFGCDVGKVIQHYGEKDATSTFGNP